LESNGLGAVLKMDEVHGGIPERPI